MRLSLASLATAALIALQHPAARADPLGPIVVQADFRDAPDEDLAISELQRHLDEFRNQVRAEDRRNPVPFGAITVEQASNLARAPLNRWKANTIAMVWGRMNRLSPNAPLRPRATLYIGPLRVRSWLPRPTNRFNTLDGVIGSDQDTDLVTYANYVGYAILLRTWATEPPARAATIARVLRRRIESDFGGPNGSSTCLDDLRAAVKTINLLASHNRPPDTISPPLTSIDPVECTPLHQ